MKENRFKQALFRYFEPEQLKLLSSARVGIAGAGGLGSNAAILLARSGVEDFVIVDHDIIEPSNLNRQHYWPGQIGLPKVEALSEHLRELNPEIRIEQRKEALDERNLGEILASAPVWVEALDRAETKRLFVERALLCDRKVASASGLGGFGGSPMQKRWLGNLVMVGDFTTDISVAPPLAPRVAQAAAMLADCVLEFILPPRTHNP